MLKTIIKLVSLFSLTASIASHDEDLRAFLTTPVQATQSAAATVELKGLQKSLVVHYLTTKKILPKNDFERFVRQEFHNEIKPPILDPWDSKYRYQPIKKGFKVLSNGPDRKKGTSDDLSLVWRDAA